MIPRWLPQRGEYLDGWEATLHRTDSRAPTTTWLEAPVIEGQSLRLRQLTDDDIPRIVEASADARSQHWLPFLPHPYTEADARGFLLRSRTRAAEGAGVDWAVASSSSDALLGTIGLPRGGRHGWEIGYLAHPDARGAGAIREAVGLVAAYLLRDAASGGLGAQRAYLRAAEGNTASRHVAVTNGFREYGRERSSETLRDGSVCDMVLYDLLRSEADV
jgi:RimJ/RimL family protein N-acetyltransferase